MPTLPRDDDDELDGNADLTMVELDEELLDPDAWPDDEEDPAIQALLDQAPGSELESLPELDLDDEDADDDAALDLEDDLLDTQHDEDFDVDLRLETATQEAIPILPLRLEIEVDGRWLPARIHTGTQGSLLVDPEVETAGERNVVLRIRGRVVQTTIHVEPGPEVRAVLGADVLHSRFLLRP